MAVFGVMPPFSSVRGYVVEELAASSFTQKMEWYPRHHSAVDDILNFRSRETSNVMSYMEHVVA
jgi:hypothetical protein